MSNKSIVSHEDVQPQSILEEFKIPFSCALIGNFFQDQPRLGNQFLEDSLLRGYLKRHLPPVVLKEASQDLERFGQRLVDEIDSLGRECELNQPHLQHYDAWGRRVDRIITCPAWQRMKVVSAEEGLVAEGYERKYSSWSRLIQVVKLYLYSPSSGMFSCPLAMTDGAAKVIESLGMPEALQDAFRHLTSTDPKIFWTSGQWMTERKGGSDVAHGIETVAHAQADGTYKLYGYKWFTSASDSDMALTLGRVMNAQGHMSGTKGLSLFYLEVRDADGELNGIEVQRLKEKLGTRQLPTAELLLDGVKALRISPEGRGVASISNMFTITRIHNTITAVAGMRRVIYLARDYASKRFVFGNLIKDHPLHMQTIARMEVQARGAFLLLMEVARLLGLQETNMATVQDENLLRLLTPIAKLYTGKQAIAVISEGLECFGGQGYMEDTGLPTLLRDAQVLTIWEGTTNILSLDVLRSVIKSQGQVLGAYFSSSQEMLEASSNVPGLSQPVSHLLQALQSLKAFTQKAGERGSNYMELAARDFAYSIAKIYIGCLFVDHAAWAGAKESDVYCAQRWSEQDLCPVITAEASGCYDSDTASMERQLVYEKSPLLKGKL
ncbi:acyl-CoA dehydrogenase family member 11-like [Ranitomeya imitator]|uniref:acyl-CoA dehydrogenase family member 11-like n=1 Tax=Ranitomeya imitator TaxID=111125 RepID=UPI0037E91FD2